MQRLKSILVKIGSTLLNTRAAGAYILLFAIAIGAATFIENDFGTSTAQKVVYQAKWFELLLLLFGGSVIYNIWKFRMIQQKKWALLTFHLAIIVILAGAAVTRYWGFEGMMHIRENDSSNYILSSRDFLVISANDGQHQYQLDEPVLFASLGNNHWKGSYLFGDQEVSVEVKEFISNPEQKIVPTDEGKPVLKMVVAGGMGREEYTLQPGESRRINGQVINFGSEVIPGAINLSYQDEQILVQVPRPFQNMVMATQEQDTLLPEDGPQPLKLRALYTDGQSSIVFPEFHPSATVELASSSPKVMRGGMNALFVEVATGGAHQTAYVQGQSGTPGQPANFQFPGIELSVAYGARKIVLPFSLSLQRFEMERYPGTHNPASYASEVDLVDPRNGYQEHHRIYMNHILNYGGYRFFQSSYDRDEKGTYLSVNHDFWGTWISYLGYALLTLGMILTLISRRTRFYQVQQKLKKLGAAPAAKALLIAGLCLGGSLWAQPATAISEDHAGKFSHLVVQDFNGRMKPMHTLSREILRKIYRKDHYESLNADQVILSFFADGQSWYTVPLVKLGLHPTIHKILGVEGKYASYRDFFDQQGRYKLQEEVRRAHAMNNADRGTLEKELLKIDERVNILDMTLSGSILKIFPNPDDPAHTWLAYPTHHHGHAHEEVSMAERFFNSYRESLAHGMSTGHFDQADMLLDELAKFQRKADGGIMPSETQVKAEIFLNNISVFNRLAGVYLILGLGFLTLLFISVFKPAISLKIPLLLLVTAAIVSFGLHTLGLGLRWFVSERAPWSNGYESMIYIGWTTTLAGLIFTRKSIGGMSATMILAGTILFVSTLSFLDPQITPLVPVLRSYWLTIHVSLEAGSYGFLMLGALIGLINLILFSLYTPEKEEKIFRVIREMSYISELTLIAGIIMLSIGTYLGGVWANESWGRYWGWDAKETWALVSILVYAFILHMRIIPKLFDLFAYNLATIFGLASILMTYYGVNYYLSGLHSYATGDPVPVPAWVYIAAGIIAFISLLAYRKKKIHHLRLRS